MIKYRGKRLSSGEWIESESILHKIVNDNTRLYIPAPKNSSSHPSWLPIVPESLCLFTTFKDANGKEIFTKDILHTRYKDEMEENGFSDVYIEVTFQKGCFGFIGEITGKFIPFIEDDLSDYKVVGNTIDNPNLIEKNNLP